MSFFIGLPDLKGLGLSEKDLAKQGLPGAKTDRPGRGSHYELAARIAGNGRDFASQQWRDIDWQVYLARVLIEWHRVVHRDEEE